MPITKMCELYTERPFLGHGTKHVDQVRYTGLVFLSFCPFICGFGAKKTCNGLRTGDDFVWGARLRNDGIPPDAAPAASTLGFLPRGCCRPADYVLRMCIALFVISYGFPPCSY